MNQQRGDTQVEFEGSSSPVDEESAKKLLRDYTEETWDMPDDVPEQATITLAEEEICHKKIERSLEVTEEHMVEEHSPSAHAQFDPEAYFVDVPVEERAEIIPSEFVEETLRFFIPNSEEESNCSKCHSRGRVPCEKCSSQGNVTCRSCSGTGTKTDSDGRTVRCKKCSGNGNRPCTTCDGIGDLTCGRCEGSGRTVKFEYFERSFEPTEEIEFISDAVPPEFLEGADGQHRVTDDLPTSGDVVRRETEVRDIPATVVEYEYGGSEYEVFEIEHEFHAASHPRDMKRWAKVAVGAVVAFAIIAGVYLFVL